MTDAPDLEPCPFCGSPASLEHDSDHHGEWFNLGCSRHWGAVEDDEPSCPGGRLWYTAGLDEEAGAISAWNRRASSSAPEAGKAVDARLEEREDDALICVPHWQWGKYAIARRPKAMTNEEWRPIANRIIAALASSTAPAGVDNNSGMVKDHLLSDPSHVTTSPAPEAEKGAAPIPGDVARLVIAARIVAFERRDAEALLELDKASEAFADRVPWDDKPYTLAPQAVAPTGEIAKRLVEIADVYKDDVAPLARETIREAAAALTASEAEAADLRRKLEEVELERNRLRENVKDLGDRKRVTGHFRDEYKARAEAAERKLEEAREALAVFVQHYEPWMEKWADDAEVSSFARHTFGDLRRARALSTQVEERE